VALTLAVALGLLVLAVVVLPPLARSHTDRWGARANELEMALPGDEFVASPTAVSTKAISIDAPPGLVYKLLIQMGYKRGGWYGWDWFYNLTGSSDFVGGHHAETIVPQLQRLRVGDRIEINQVVGYDVAELSPAGDAKPGWMLLTGAMGTDGKPVDANNPPPGSIKMSWAWFVYPATDGTTRLVLRIRTGGDSQGAFLDWLYDNPLDLGGAIMGYKTLAGIRDTAEKLAREGVR
jgi:hypothetical protein